jgi:hypothetical protein
MLNPIRGLRAKNIMCSQLEGNDDGIGYELRTEDQFTLVIPVNPRHEPYRPTKTSVYALTRWGTRESARETYEPKFSLVSSMTAESDATSLGEMTMMQSLPPTFMEVLSTLSVGMCFLAPTFDHSVDHGQGLWTSDLCRRDDTVTRTTFGESTVSIDSIDVGETSTYGTSARDTSEGNTSACDTWGEKMPDMDEWKDFAHIDSLRTDLISPPTEETEAKQTLYSKSEGEVDIGEETVSALVPVVSVPEESRKRLPKLFRGRRNKKRQSGGAREKMKIPKSTCLMMPKL